MKLLTVNFLTCAVKSCKSALSSSATTSAVNKSKSGQTSPSIAQDDELSPYPLHFRDAVLERLEINYNPLFIENILPRLNWEALSTTARELGLTGLMPSNNPLDDPDWDRGLESGGGSHLGGDYAAAAAAAAAITETNGQEMEVEAQHAQQETLEHDKSQKEKVLRQLHTLLLETNVTEGKLVCGKCAFEYPIKEGVGNFLLPSHLGEWLPSPLLHHSSLFSLSPDICWFSEE